MHRHIALERRFAPISNEELRDPDFVSRFGKERYGALDWTDMLKRSPVVFLGEGRSGKTHEFQRQVAKLKDQGGFAFFIPLEALHNEDVVDTLSLEDESAFEDWKSSADAVAYMFLDALDELKLREGSLQTAIKKLYKSVMPHVARVRLFLSCRPADWTTEIDIRQLDRFVVGQSTSRKASTLGDISAEEAFISAISSSKLAGDDEATEREKKSEKIINSVFIATLLSLSNDEVRNFAKDYEPEYASIFCEHLEKHDLWHLYRLPADIIGALDQMKSGEPLGSLEEQLKFGIQQKLSEGKNKKRKSVDIERATLGAERIAFAMFMMKRRSIRIDGTADAMTLDVGQILTDWPADDQNELISKSLFDPSGVGAVRFHHRSTQEFLAAKRLDRLLKDGMPWAEFSALLFDEVGGEAVVKPSMAPVAAWLALWNPAVRKIVRQREPRLMLNQGLPSAMSIEIRAEMLRSYIKQYAGKDWCRAGVGHSDVRRISHPDLGPVVRELWDEGYTGHDSRELLLELVWIGPLSDCVDLVLNAVWDTDLPYHHRTYACWGVIVSGTNEQKRSVAEGIINGTIPECVMRSVIPELLPQTISIAEFMTIVNSAQEVPKSVRGLNYAILSSLRSDKLSTTQRTLLRKSLASEVWDNRLDISGMYQAHSTKDHFQDGLIACCSRTIPIVGNNVSEWAWDTAVALHFGEKRTSIVAKEETEETISALKDRLDLREAYFWACIEMSDAMEGKEDDWGRVINATSHSRQVIGFADHDKNWLVSSLGPDAADDRRAVAYRALTGLFDIRSDKILQASIAQAIVDKPSFQKHLEKVLNPEPREPDEFEIEMRQLDQKTADDEAKRVAVWLTWRAEVLADSDFRLAGDQRLSTIYDAHKIIEQGRGSFGAWGQWDANLIATIMSEAFLDRYRRELSVFWRDQTVKLRSERQPDERSSVNRNWLLALSAVKAEAEIDGWANSLSQEEATLAMRIACMELNGFAGYFVDLSLAHPTVVANVVASEVDRELLHLSETGAGEMPHEILYHGSDQMKAAVAPLIAPTVASIVADRAIQTHNVLSCALQIIAQHGTNEAKAPVVDALIAALDQPDCQHRRSLLKHLAKFDPERASHKLLDATAELTMSDQKSEAISLFAEVFGDRYSRSAPNLLVIQEDRRIPLLIQLVIRSYQAIRRDEDVSHDGVYSPGLRDNAEDARSLLFDTLVSQKSPAALAALHFLAAQPEFDHMPDRLREMAREMAGQISDSNPMPLAAFQRLDKDGTFVPHDNQSLLKVTMTRLDAFEHDMLHAQDTTVGTLRKADQELEIRRFIAHWLRLQDSGVFDFTQEAVVVDEKRTEIRFQPRTMQGYATVELKRETWSGAEMEVALRDQLVGRYLRHKDCKVGILLICMREPKTWRNPQTNKLMSLPQLVIWLSRVADQIMRERPDLNLEIKGIDYTRNG